MANLPLIFSGNRTQFLWISPGGEMSAEAFQRQRRCKKSSSVIEESAIRIEPQPSNAVYLRYTLLSKRINRGSSQPPFHPPPERYATGGIAGDGFLFSYIPSSGTNAGSSKRCWTYTPSSLEAYPSTETSSPPIARYKRWMRLSAYTAPGLNVAFISQ